VEPGGGGILIGGASQPQILNNTISNNSTGVDGGGISLFAAGTPTISGNSFPDAVEPNRASATSGSPPDNEVDIVVAHYTAGEV
jgi:parallel beta-helix repeat protein